MKRAIATLWLVVCIAILIIGVATSGYFFFKNRSERKKDQTDSTLTKTEEQSGETIQETIPPEEISPVTGSSLLTYQSTNYSYSFKYPASFSIVDWLWDRQSSQRLPTYGKTVWVDKNQLSEQAIPAESDPSSHYFAVNVIDRECGLSEISGEGIEIEEITFLGQNAWKTRVVDASLMMDTQYRTTIYINRSSKCYALEAINSDATGTHDPEVDEMIGSFEFL